MNNFSPANIDPTRLGRRIRVARTQASMTQARAAEAIGVARTTLVAIENGTRAMRPEEVFALSAALGLSANRLLRDEAVHVDLSPQFRKLGGSDAQQVQDASAQFARLVRAEVELERLLDERRTPSILFERPILPGDPAEQAESDALELRNILGLGTGPIHDLFGLMELDLQIRLYAAPLPGRLSGMFAHAPEAGLMVLLNSNHPLTRQRQSASHELGHAVGSRRSPDIERIQACGNTREERYATAFGTAFLVPASHARRRFGQMMGNARSFTRRHVIVLAHEYGISWEALVRRFEAIRLVKSGTWDWFVDHGGIKREQAADVLGLEAIERAQISTAAARTSSRIDGLAVRALRDGLLTEGQLAELLGYERPRVRMLRQEASEAADDLA